MNKQIKALMTWYYIAVKSIMKTVKLVLKGRCGYKREIVMISAISVASYFIEKSSRIPENDLTNLKLQKILFYAQAESLNHQADPLFGDTIEAWKYGPVVPAVYDWLKGCGAYPVTAFDVTTDTSEIDQQTSVFLDYVWESYSKYSAGFLVDRTHEVGSPWREIYQEGKNSVIPNDQIRSAKLQEAW